MVNGASGDGKSSLIFAGVIPFAKAGFFKAKYNNWLVADFRPERSPLKNLTASLCKQLKIDNTANTEKKLGYGFSALCDLYKASPFYIDESKSEWLTADETQKKALKRKGANLLLLVDQFEEFFTNPENYSNGVPSLESQKTVNLLLETYKIAAAHNLPIYVVCTMRSDYIGQCAAFRGLPEAIGYSQFFVPRLKRQEIEQVIEGPAELAGGKISKRLTQTLINNLTEGFDQLPILQHALNHVWKMADNGEKELDLIHLAQVGGISPKSLPLEDREKFNLWFEHLPEYKKQLLENPSLSNVLNAHANELYLTAHLHFKEKFGEEISIEQSQKVIKGVFTCLTKMDKGRAVRNRMTLEEITQIINDKQVNSQTVDRLLSIYREQGNTFLQPFIAADETYRPLSGDQVLDITHESLIRNWTQLTEWAKEEYEHLQNYLDFSKQLDRWVSNNYSSGFLLPIGPLTYFEDWFEKLNPSKYWILRYESYVENGSQKLKMAEKRLEDSISFIKQSEKKLFFSRFVLKHGANKIALIIVLMATLAAITYYYFDFRIKQNEYLVEESIDKSNKLFSDKKIHAISKAKFLIANDRFRETNNLEPECIVRLNQLKNDTIALDIAIAMIQELTKKNTNDTSIYNPSGHISTKVFDFGADIFLQFTDSKFQALNRNQFKDIKVDQMNWFLGTCMLMKFYYPKNTRVQSKVLKVTEAVNKLLKKSIETGEYEILGITNENLISVYISLLALEEKPNYRKLLSVISPYEGNSTIQKRFENLFIGKPEIYLNWNKQPMGGYYELLSILYATEFETNPGAKEHLKKLISTSLNLNYGIYVPKLINDVLLKFCSSPSQAMIYINNVSVKLDNEIFLMEKPKYFFIDLTNSGLTFLPQHSKINFFIPAENKEKIWKDAEKLFLKENSMEGKLQLANFYKFYGYYYSAFFHNNNKANYYFKKAFQVFESINEKDRSKEFEVTSNTRDVWSSGTFQFLQPVPMASFEYIKSNNTHSSSPGFSEFVNNLDNRPFYDYIIKNNKFNTFSSNYGFEVISTLNETNNPKTRKQIDSIIVKVYENLKNIIESKYQKDLTSQFIYAKINLASGKSNFESKIRSELFNNKSLQINYSNIKEKLTIERNRVILFSKILIEKNSLSLCDSILFLLPKEGKSESLLKLYLEIAGKGQPEVEMKLLNLMLKSKAEEKIYWAPEFFRVLGKTGGQKIENYSLEEIRSYPEMGKSIILQKYFLGILESNRYFKALEILPEYISKSGLLEKYALMIRIEAIKRSPPLKEKNWNDSDLRTYETNIDTYFEKMMGN